MTSTLILLCHGNSEWNQKNLFTGWVDVRLSEQGVAEAERAGELLAESGLHPDILYTSVLTRAIQTANLALDVADRAWIPVKRSWRLNERHYGALQGLDKAETLEKYGEQQFMEWRRSFDVPPPPLADDAEFSQFGDPRYADVPDAEFPRTESLKLVIDRMLPYWESDITKDLAAGKTIQCPTYLIWSEFYLVSGPVGAQQPLEIWHKSFAPRATGIGVSSGHIVAEENPGATLEALQAFLQS